MLVGDRSTKPDECRPLPQGRKPGSVWLPARAKDAAVRWKLGLIVSQKIVGQKRQIQPLLTHDHENTGKTGGTKRDKVGGFAVRRRQFTRLAHDPGQPSSVDAVLSQRPAVSALLRGTVVSRVA